jgi:hypothetical protein
MFLALFARLVQELINQIPVIANAVTADFAAVQPTTIFICMQGKPCSSPILSSVHLSNRV